MSRKTKVYFKRGSRDYFLKKPQQILDGLKKAGLAPAIAKGDFTALKIHFGEEDNRSYIPPSLLSALVKFLKKRGAKPFFLETNTLYRGKRMNAVDHINLAGKHGFGRLNIPVIIGDGIKGRDYTAVPINQKHFKDCFLAAALADVDCLLVLSHFTGHMLTGFGAAVKNLGMGCAARRGKLQQHCRVSPEISAGRCVGCGICARACPVGAIKQRDKAYAVEAEACIGCAQCVSVCPQGAVKIIWSEEYNTLGEKMAEYALAAAAGRKCIYINFCFYITKECDCMNKEKREFIPDLGILFGADPVSIDKASIDLLLARENKDVLKQIHPQIDYLHHLRYAQDIGLGSLDYKLVEI